MELNRSACDLAAASAARSRAARSRCAARRRAPRRRLARRAWRGPGRLAVAIDVRRDDRGPRCHRLQGDKAEALAAQGRDADARRPRGGARASRRRRARRATRCAVGAEAPLERLGRRSVAEHPADDRQVEVRHRSSGTPRPFAPRGARRRAPSALIVGVGVAASTRSDSTPLNSTSVSRARAPRRSVPAALAHRGGDVDASAEPPDHGRAERVRRSPATAVKRRDGGAPVLAQQVVGRHGGERLVDVDDPAAQRRGDRGEGPRRGARERHGCARAVRSDADHVADRGVGDAGGDEARVDGARRADDDVDAAPLEVPGHRAHLGLDPAGHAERVGAHEDDALDRRRHDAAGQFDCRTCHCSGARRISHPELVGDELGHPRRRPRAALRAAGCRSAG